MAKHPFHFSSRRETDYRLVQPKQRPSRPRKPGQSVFDYVLSQTGTDEPIRIVGNGKPKGPIRISNHPMLFETFSKIGPTLEDDEPPKYLDGSDEALLDFVKRYGRLTNDKSGDNVDQLLDEAGRMKNLLNAFERHKLRVSVRVSDLEATASLNPKTGTVDIQPLPQTLLQALWLQLIYFLCRGHGGELRKCQRPGCTIEFSVGAGGMRTDARFCSPKCRVLFNSLERSKPTHREKRK